MPNEQDKALKILDKALEQVEQRIDRLKNSTPLNRLLSEAQKAALHECLRGEEAVFFIEKLKEVQRIADHTPRTYQTEQSEAVKVATMHYFLNGWDWYLVEMDMQKELTQCFGLVKGYEKELGYFSLPEILKTGAELDLYWTPTPINEIK